MRRTNGKTPISPSRMNRRALYRRAKKSLHHALIQHWTDSRSSLEKHIRAFLRGKNHVYLSRIVRKQAFTLAVAATLLTGATANAFPPIELSDVSMNANAGGFVINGVNENDGSSWSVSGAGDVNGDGLDDLIVGAPGADPGGRDDAGESYVVFGKADGTAVELSTVAAGTGGFIINGIDTWDSSGSGVSGAGDVNGDGLDDLIVGAPGADPDDVYNVGESYVVFGKTDGAVVELSTIASGAGGFVMRGVLFADYFGTSVSGAGDVNNDGLADVIIGAPEGEPVGQNREEGVSYVVFGKADGAVVDMSNVVSGAGGFAINGINRGDHSGNSVSGAGDVNGDGLADLIVGAWRADRGGLYNAGECYVVFGKADGGWVELSSLQADNNGFKIKALDQRDYSGFSVSGAGDVNGDGLADVIVGAPSADTGFGNTGASYVIFGKADSTRVNVSDIVAGTGGFVINGTPDGRRSGSSVSEAGDVNGDGLGDLIVGAWLADPAGVDAAGESYVVFGKADTEAVELSAVASGSGGFVINGIDVNDRSGHSVSRAGDVNGDGFADLIIGALLADPGGSESAGESYVVFSPIPGPHQWVDFAYTGPKEGRFWYPFQELEHALNALTVGGTIFIKGDTAVSSTSGSFTLDKPMTIEAFNGTVTIGAP